MYQVRLGRAKGVEQLNSNQLLEYYCTVEAATLYASGGVVTNAGRVGLRFSLGSVSHQPHSFYS